VNPALEQLRTATQGTPYEGRLWVVGGAVRDALIAGVVLHEASFADIDITLEGDALELARWLHQQGVSEIYPVLYPRFGTAMVRIAGEQVEFATARGENYVGDSRKPEVHPATLLADATRRDFTCNALSWNVHSGEIGDPLGIGMSDLRAKVLRTPTDPRRTFSEDPLRILRAVRFKHQLGFQFAEGLAEVIQQCAPRLEIISQERIMQEFSKMLTGPNPAGALGDLMSLGILKEFAPEFCPMVGMEQGPYHHLDVWDHTLAVVNAAPRGDLLLNTAALFHDIGKPSTREVDAEGRTRFFDHENVGARMADDILRRLKFPFEFARDVSRLVALHMRLTGIEKWSATASRRLVRDAGDLLEPLLDLVAADRSGHGPKAPAYDMTEIRETLDRVSARAQVVPLDSPLNGEQIMLELNVAPGRVVKEAKEFLTEEVLEGRLEAGDEASARNLLQAWYANKTR